MRTAWSSSYKEDRVAFAKTDRPDFGAIDGVVFTVRLTVREALCEGTGADKQEKE